MAFDEQEYKSILKKFSEYIVPFDSNINSSRKPQKKVYLRHDIEADLEMALYLAKLNNRYGAVGSFMVQVCSEFYNVNTAKNLNILKNISDLGQEIGLHYYSEYRESKNFAFQDFAFQSEILNCALTQNKLQKFKVFSYHRPTPIQLEVSSIRQIPDGYIDCYSPEYFTYSSSLTDITIKYMSDSDHEWRYGHPLDFEFGIYDTAQILMHPEEWRAKDTSQVYDKILEAQTKNLKEALNKEYKKYNL